MYVNSVIYTYACVSSEEMTRKIQKHRGNDTDWFIVFNATFNNITVIMDKTHHTTPLFIRYSVHKLCTMFISGSV